MKHCIWISLCCAVFIAAAPAARALDARIPPGSNFDLSHWKLTLPIDVSGGTASNAVEISTAQLTAGFTNDYFYTGSGGEMVFWCPANGARTEGTSYPRAELREMLNPTNSAFNWTGAGTHILNAQCRVTQQPSTKKVIIGQIHSYTGAARPLIKLQYNNGTIEALVKFSPNLDPDTKYTFANIGLGNLITYQINVTDGLLTVTVNGISKGTNVFLTDPDWANQTLYFKAGNYLQDNTGTSTNGGVVSFSALNVSHTSLVNLYAPVIGAVPTQTVDPGAVLSLSIPAIDNDLPAQTLSYLLLSAPAGATLSGTGLFTWAPSPAQAATSNLVVLSVTDSGATPMSATRSFVVMVNPGSPCTGFKADVAPRGKPNGVLTISDWVQIGRFAAGVEPVLNDCERIRADCAPRPCGNGTISISDWVQAGRVAAGLDGMLPVSNCPPAGAFAPAGASPPPAPAEGFPRALRATNTAFERGRTNFLQIRLQSLGGENGLQFSLEFDTNHIAYVDANLVGAATNAALFFKNTSQAAQGRVGFFFGLNSNTGFTEGPQPVLEIGFSPVAGTGLASSPILFGNQPIHCEIVDVNANVVPAGYENGLAIITSENGSAFKAITYGRGGQPTLTLLGAPGGVLNLEESLDLRNWRRIATLTNLTGLSEYTDPLTPSSNQRFYRALRR